MVQGGKGWRWEGGEQGEGRLSLCPTKKSPYGDMNLNKVRTKGGGWVGWGEG